MLSVLIGATAATLLGALLLAGAVLVVHARIQRRSARLTRLEAEWRPLVLDVLAGASGPGDFWGRIRPADVPDALDLAGRLAIRLRGAEQAGVRALAAPALDRLLPELTDRRADVRARAARTLGLLGNEAHVARLTSTLDDPEASVVLAAARVLASNRWPELARVVVARVDRLEAWDRRFLAALLAGFGPTAAPELRRLARDTARGAAGRTAALDALAELGDLDAADDAAELLERESDAELRAACLRLLGSLGAPRHRPIVQRHLDDPSELLRIEAVRALAAVGDAADGEALERALDDPSPWVALRAARGLRELGAGERLARHAEEGGRRGVLAREILEDGP
jgi:HEAT repeat protein